MSNVQDVRDVEEGVVALLRGDGPRVNSFSTELDEEAWRHYVDGGFAGISVSPAAGGSGGELSEAYAALRAVGRTAAAIPALEGGLLPGWLAERAGLALGDGLTVVVPPDQSRLAYENTPAGGRLSGRADRVAWASAADDLLFVLDELTGQLVVRVPRSAVQVRRHTNLAGEPLDDLELVDVPVATDRIGPISDRTVAQQLRQRWALGKANLMAGAARSVAALCADYANTRAQFGRPIVRFQAIAELLVRVASEAACLGLAAEVASQQYSRQEDLVPAAIAKIVAGGCAATVASHGHQLHGAIGMTQEYALQKYTRRLWAWQHEAGSANWWAARLGQVVLDLSPDQVWELLTSGLEDADERREA